MTTYFISFLFESPTGLSAGNCQLTVKNPITTWDDVQAVTAWLRDQGYRTATLMSFSPLDYPMPQSGATR